MINSIVRLRDLCEIMISMGFSESVNEKEIKELIAKLETIISEEIKLLEEHESTSDWEWALKGYKWGNRLLLIDLFESSFDP